MAGIAATGSATWLEGCRSAGPARFQLESQHGSSLVTQQQQWQRRQKARQPTAHSHSSRSGAGHEQRASSVPQGSAQAPAPLNSFSLDPATEAADADWAAVPPAGDNAAPPSLQAPASRLQQEVDQLVALDVEYTHLAVQPGGRHVSLPAEVCAVDAAGRVLLHEHCNPVDGTALEGQRWVFKGGMPPPLWQLAPPLSQVRNQLEQLLAGRILVGHHLAKDLAALELAHPACDLRDTLRYRELQGRRGAGRTLRTLSAEKLGRHIQRSRRHSPREDAQAAMDLYLQEVHFKRQYMQYDDLVQLHLAQLLGNPATASSEGNGGDRSGGTADSSSLQGSGQ